MRNTRVVVVVLFVGACVCPSRLDFVRCIPLSEALSWCSCTGLCTAWCGPTLLQSALGCLPCETCSSWQSLFMTAASPVKRSTFIFASSSLLRHGTVTSISRLLRSHRSLTVFLWTILVGHAPLRFSTITSPVVAWCPHTRIFPHARQLSKRTSAFCEYFSRATRAIKSQAHRTEKHERVPSRWKPKKKQGEDKRTCVVKTLPTWKWTVTEQNQCHSVWPRDFHSVPRHTGHFGGVDLSLPILTARPGWCQPSRLTTDFLAMQISSGKLSLGSSLTDKKLSFSVFVQSTLPWPANLCPPFFASLFLVTSFNLIFHDQFRHGSSPTYNVSMLLKHLMFNCWCWNCFTIPAIAIDTCGARTHALFRDTILIIFEKHEKSNLDHSIKWTACHHHKKKDTTHPSQNLQAGRRLFI